MHITYDAKVDALYIKFKKVHTTSKLLAKGIAADYDIDGNLAGIEIIDAIKRFGSKNTLKKITLEEVGLAS